MPMFYFDTDDGDHAVEDGIGVALSGLEEAAQEAAGLICDLARHEQAIGRRRIVAVVRDHAGSPVYRATMTITGAAVDIRGTRSGAVDVQAVAGRG